MTGLPPWERRDQLAQDPPQFGLAPVPPDIGYTPQPAPGPAVEPQQPQEPEPEPPPFDPARWDEVTAQLNRRREAAFAESMAAAAEKDPALRGEAMRLAAEHGVDTATAEGNIEAFRLLQRTRALQYAALSGSSRMAERLADRDFATIVADDLDNATWTDKLSMAWNSGVLAQKLGPLELKIGMGTATAEERSTAANMRRQLAGIRQAGGFYTAAGFAAQMTTQLPEAVAAGMATGVATGAVSAAVGGPAAPLTGTGGFVGGFWAGFWPALTFSVAKQTFEAEAGGLYRQLSAPVSEGGRGYAHEQALPAAIAYGYVSTLAELTGEALIAHGAGALRPILRASAPQVGQRAVAAALARPTMTAGALKAARMWAAGTLGEAGTETFQQLASITAEELARQFSENPERLQSAVTEGKVLQQLVDTAVDTAMGASLIALPGPLHVAMRERQRVEHSLAQRKFAADFLAAATDSKVRERNPGAYAAFVEATTDGTSVETTYIPVDTFRQEAHANGVSLDALAAAIPGLDVQLEAGQDLISMPTAAFVEHVAGTPLGTALQPHVRFDPDGATLQELAEVTPLIEKQEKLLTEAAQKREDFAKSAREVELDMLEKLRATSDRKVGELRLQARLHRAFMSTLATKTGKLPLDEHKRWALSLRREQPGTVRDSFSQSTRVATETPEFKAWFGSSKVVDTVGRPLVVYHGTDREIEGGVFDTQDVANQDIDSGLGFFFAGRPSEATYFTQQPVSTTGARSDVVMQGGQIVPVYLALQNPKIYETQSDLREAVADSYHREGRGVGLQEALRAEGYDGVIVRDSNMDPDGGGLWAIAFDPEQIKSVNNRGTFDPNDPNILHQEQSTRVPTGKAPVGDPASEVLVVGYEVLLADKPKLKQNADLLRSYGFLPGVDGATDEQTAEAFIQHVVDNLLWLHDQMPQAERDRARLWYDGARRIAETLADRYGLTVARTSAVLASQSPQKNWFINVTLAERILDIMHTQSGTAWSAAMTKRANLPGKKPKGKQRKKQLPPPKGWSTAEILRHIGGKTLGEVLNDPDPSVAAYWIRVYDQTYNKPGLTLITPEGGAAGRWNTRVQWGGYDTIAKAIAAVRDGSAENISRVLGDKHKVRSFYDNIFAPNSPLGHVTIDTHAVAAGLMIPVSGESSLTINAWGSGAATSKQTGVLGLYPLYVEAYNRAANERGLLGREMQSITWEQVRKQFPDVYKRADQGLGEDGDAVDSQAVTAAVSVWKRYGTGEIDAAQARTAVTSVAEPGRVFWTDLAADTPFHGTYEGESRTAAALSPQPGRTHAGTRLLLAARPNKDPELLAAWDALTPDQQRVATAEVLRVAVDTVLRDVGATGQIVDARGAWNGAPEDSIALMLDDPRHAVDVADLLGAALFQESILSLSLTPSKGLDEGQVVFITLPEGLSTAQVDDFYSRHLWPILGANGNHAAPGHTTQGRHMMILVDPESAGMTASQLADEIAKRAPSIDVHAGVAHFSFRNHGQHYATTTEQQSATGRSPAEAGDADRVGAQSAPDIAALYRDVIARVAREPGDTFRQDTGESAGSGDAGRQPARRADSPLEGAPNGPGQRGPDPNLVAVAEQYARDAGLTLRRQDTYVDVDPERAARIADAYEAMPHAPDDPKVKAAYADLIRQTRAQYDALVAAGYSFTFFDAATDPYAGNPWNAMRDLRANKRMAVYGTYDGYGTDGITGAQVDTNPMLADTGLVWQDQRGVGHPVTANDLFRAVHDAFGHGLEGAGFRARGEENAWQAHVRLFTGPAVGAITSETRGQNSWLNYGPHGAKNQTARVEGTVFAEQKTGLLPEWTWTEGRAGDAVFQSGPRGDFDPARMEITFTPNANLTTFLHESAHYYLTVYSQMAADPSSPQSVRDDMQAVLDWFGVADVATWNGMSVAQQRPHHEAFAYNFELFLFGEKIPDRKLKSAFQRFAKWLRNAYGNVQQGVAAAFRKGTGGDLPPLSDEVRDVMTRMLVAERTVDQAEASIGLVPMFQTQQESGMSDQRWAEYQATLEDAREAAVTDLARATVRQMVWLRNATSRVMKQLRTRYDALSKARRPAVEEEVRKERVYVAREQLTNGEIDTLDGRVKFKLHRGQVDELVPRQPGDAEQTEVVDVRRYARADGVDVHAAARMLGYETAAEMLLDLRFAPTLEDAIETRLRDTLAKERDPVIGLMQGPASDLEAWIADHLSDEARARFVAVELRFLQGATAPARVVRAAAREAAKRALDKTTVGVVRPRAFLQTAARLSRETQTAMQEGRSDDAIQAKQRQLLAHEQHRLAVEFRAEVDSLHKLVAKLQRSDKDLADTRDVDLVAAARTIAATLGLGPVNPDLPPRAAMALVAEHNPVLAAALEPMIARVEAVAGAARARGGVADKPLFHRLTVSEFRGAAELLEAVWETAGQNMSTARAGRQTTRQEAVAAVRARIAERVPATTPGERATLSDRTRWWLHALNLKAATRRVEHWLRWLDGGKAGPLVQHLWAPMQDAVVRYHTAKLAHITRLRDLIRTVDLGGPAISAPELGDGTNPFVFTSRDHLLGALLHTGNQGNLRRLVLGLWGQGAMHAGMDPDTAFAQALGQWRKFLQRAERDGIITEADWKFVRSVWAQNEELKTGAQAAHKQLYGYRFRQVESTPVETSFGTFPGGYVPAKVDPDVGDRRLGADAVSVDQLAAQTRDALPVLRSAFVKERVEDFAQPLLMSVRLVPQHVDEVLRFTCLHPPAQEILALLRDKKLAADLNRMDRTAVNETLLPWLKRTVEQSVVTRSGWPGVDSVLSFLRRNAGLRVMFAHVVNAVQQTTGFANALLYVSPRYLFSAATRVLRPGLVDRVAAQSPFMRQRMRDQIGALQDDIALSFNPSTYAAIQRWVTRHGYFAQQFVQNRVDAVTWVAAYDQHMVKTDDHEASIAEADSVVRRTQGSTAPESSARYEVGTPAWRLLTQFSSFFNTLLNQQVYRGANTGRVKAAILGMIVPTVAAAAIGTAFGTGARMDDDEDGDITAREAALWVLAAEAKGVAGLIPVAGPIGTSIVSSAGDRMSVSPVTSSLQSLARSVDSLLNSEGPVQGRAVDDLLGAIHMLTGLPVAPLGRPARYLIDSAQGRVQPAAGPVDYVRGLLTGRGATR